MKLTIITICLNAESFLGVTMHSVLSQCQVDLEYLLVDGGSSDATLMIIREAMALDPRVVLVSQNGQGISHAMNRGLALAQGEVVGFLHADDRYLDDGVLHRVARAFHEHPWAEWLTGGIREIDETGQILRSLPLRHYSRRRLLRNNVLFHPATFVKTALLRKLGGFDEDLSYAMDYDLWLRLAQRSTPICFDSLLADFRVHPGSLSSAARRHAIDEEYQVRRRYLSPGPASLFHAAYQRLRLGLARNTPQG